MPRELLERKDIVKKTTYHPQDPIASIFSAFEELLRFAEITRTSYTKHQAVNIIYVITQRIGKRGLEICKWNCMSTIQNMWVGFKQFVQTEDQ